MLVNVDELYLLNTRFSRNLSYCTVSLWSILLAQHQFNVLFCHPLAGNLFVSLTASWHLSNYIFINKYILYPQTHRFVIWSHVVCSLPWQRLQLILCHINNFYGKVSSVDKALKKPTDEKPIRGSSRQPDSFTGTCPENARTNSEDVDMAA